MRKGKVLNMKKGLINIILLVLAVTNVVLTAVMVFAVVPAMNSTSDLVSKVASAIDLEKEGEKQYTDTISIDDLVTYNFTDKITVALNGSSNNNVHYAQFNITLSLNKKADGYSKYNEKLKDNEELMKSKIMSIVSKYTTAEIQNNQTAILEEITLALREMYNNTGFIYETSFVNIVFQ